MTRTERVLGGRDIHPRRREYLERFGDDFGADSITGDDCEIHGVHDTGELKGGIFSNFRSEIRGEVKASPFPDQLRSVRAMSIGTGIVLFVIGAILTFALNFETGFINLDLVGYILMAAGAVTFVIGLVLMMRKRQSVTTVQSGVDASGATVQERRTSTTPPTDVV